MRLLYTPMQGCDSEYGWDIKLFTGSGLNRKRNHTT